MTQEANFAPESGATGEAGPLESASLAPLEALVRVAAKAGAHIPVRLTPLAGGVSSDIYRADCGSLTCAVKRALPKLKVAADWRAPVERNRWEVDWMRVAGGVVPGAVPEILGEDRAAGAFAMAYLPPERFPVWKGLLASGAVDLATAARVGEVLGRIHAATADRPDIAARFATDSIFHAIRLEPYLEATARVHADLADALTRLSRTTAATRRVLVHGDFSPKNLLVGPQGPVVLDAECAWFGDPAFDLAFVLNHLVLKGVWHPAWRQRYLEAFRELVNAYCVHVGWESWPVLEARVAALLPGLMLARVDGKSPAEYLTAAGDCEAVRAFARAHVATPVRTLAELAADWLAAPVAGPA
jgi:aminoglycoside phosphotransferase (APT) family kinase protein